MKKQIEMYTAEQICETLKSAEKKENQKIQKRFFKAGPGEYGEGDLFLGLKNPEVRSFVKQFKNISVTEAEKLLDSPFHEIRLCGGLILAAQFTKKDDDFRKEILNVYLKKIRKFNNWDLVDLTAPEIVGTYLLTHDRSILRKLAESSSLWENRIAIVSTLTLIRNGELFDTFDIVLKLINHPHDLIHKACGWMLREAGKRDKKQLTEFLNTYKNQMPRTMLRYAIEKFSQEQRQAFLKKA